MIKLKDCVTPIGEKIVVCTFGIKRNLSHIFFLTNAKWRKLKLETKKREQGDH